MLRYKVIFPLDGTEAEVATRQAVLDTIKEAFDPFMDPGDSIRQNLAGTHFWVSNDLGEPIDDARAEVVDRHFSGPPEAPVQHLGIQGGYIVNTKTGEDVAEINPNSADDRLDEMENSEYWWAVAHLFAGAPALLRACELVLALDRQDDGVDCVGLAPKTREQLEQAVALAKGETK